ncbi:MAG: type VI secretion system tip protein TssI/VgrG [Acidobacteriota bacterium]|jgi:type VI secretion system secreted protein VgrG
MANLQQERLVEVIGPLAENKLLFWRMRGTEELGRMFTYEVDLLSEDTGIKLEDVLARTMTLRIDLMEGGKRHFNGFVTRFTQVGQRGRYGLYRAVLRPWLWFLTRTADCRIFQGKTVPEILREVAQEHGFSDAQSKLSGEYRRWTYCVQYRETDFEFISRLLEREGIYYYFLHDEGKHTLVLSDGYSSHPKFPREDVPWRPLGEAPSELQHVHAWNRWQEVQPGKYALNDYDLERPGADLKVNATVSRQHPYSKFEMYDYPGQYADTGPSAGTFDSRTVTRWGEDYAKKRIAALQADHDCVNAESNHRAVGTGALFTLAEHARSDQNGEYLVVSTSYEIESNIYETAAAGAESENRYAVSFRAIPGRTEFRPGRTTPKPVVQGPQTAVVVGKSGEEIWTDEYGRVKVQFPWDRYGKRDENSSCWVRVAQTWAGTNWGGVQLPRIGQEVIVEFLEGDPDRPIITGRVYNAVALPPYTLPDNRTQSGVKSRSSKEGNEENFNEIRFEDLKGEEQLFIHAERNQDIEVENDETHWVGNDRQKKVDNDEKTNIGNDRTEEVGNDETIKIGNDKTIEIGQNHQETVGGDQTVTVKKKRTDSVSEDEERTVGGNRKRTVAKAETISVGSDQKVSVDKNRSVAVKMDDGLTVSGNLSVQVDRNYDTAVKGNRSLEAKKVSTDAADEISLQAGSASITLKKNGDITIKGNKITIKGSSDVIIKGSKIAEN